MWFNLGYRGEAVHLVSASGPDTYLATVNPLNGLSLTRRVEPPGSRRLVGIALSPDGQKLCWVLLKYGPEKRSAAVRLWLSGSDGSSFRELAHNDGVRTNKPFQPQMLTWRPDNSAVAYMYRDSLYLLPVN